MVVLINNKTGYKIVGKETSCKIVAIKFCLLVIFLTSVIWSIQKYRKLDIETTFLSLHPTKTLTVSREFLSFGLDSSLLRNVKKMPIQDKRFLDLTRPLSPAFVRFGGTSADCLQFKENGQTGSNRILDIDIHDISNFTITGRDFLSLYKYTEKSQLKMMFDLNVLLRNSNGTWDSTNARSIITFAKSHGMEIDWQMGNEPNSFHHVFNRSVSSKQLADDYCQLRSLLNEIGYEKSLIVGPEANHIGDENRSGAIYATEFLKNVGECVDVVTWHQYYLDGHTATVQDFTNPAIFKRLPAQIEVMKNVILSSQPKISMWMSETSSAYGGGAPELSNRYVAGFLWLDKLGYSAKAGVQVVVRQSLFGGNYSLIGNDLRPNPDWWVSVLYKKLVSEKVLYLSSTNNNEYLRLYAHCTPKCVSKFGVTIFGVNLLDRALQIVIQHPTSSKILQYTLTSDDLQSRNIMLNGAILRQKTDGSLPPLIPQTLDPNAAVILPPRSMVFLVIDGFQWLPCSE